MPSAPPPSSSKILDTDHDDTVTLSPQHLTTHRAGSGTITPLSMTDDESEGKEAYHTADENEVLRPELSAPSVSAHAEGKLSDEGPTTHRGRSTSQGSEAKQRENGVAQKDFAVAPSESVGIVGGIFKRLGVS